MVFTLPSLSMSSRARITPGNSPEVVYTRLR